MFRIGEFSRLMQVTIRMLRYYDEMGLLKLEEIDTQTNYRMYSVEQIPVSNKIVYLRDSGFSVAEIAAALKSEDDGFVLEHFDRKYKEIEQTIQLEKEKLRKIELAKKELQISQNEMHYNITIKQVPSYQVIHFQFTTTSNIKNKMWMWSCVR